MTFAEVLTELRKPETGPTRKFKRLGWNNHPYFGGIYKVVDLSSWKPGQTISRPAIMISPLTRDFHSTPEDFFADDWIEVEL